MQTSSANTLRKVPNEPNPLIELHKMEVSRNQYKHELEHQQLINNLIEADLRNMLKRYTRYGSQSSCARTQLICSLIVTDLQKAIDNKSFTLNQLIA